MQHYLIIDFEATCCDQGSIPRHQMEIIEIGAVMVDSQTLQLIDEFQSFIKPVRYPKLTTFCTQLTSITQQQVDKATTFKNFIAPFKTWLYQYKKFAFCSWGDYDYNQLNQDCQYHQVANPISAKHINIKRLMAEKQQLQKKPGLGQALKLANMEFIGTAHRGIDDARNMVRLLPYIFGDKKLP
ncbi:exonuclease domain-containing protein [Entomomonas sp. E2T0]|uniref:3'-5' exonuclease n=1 Tax=Entomomonas sp. E2T0 TaxID=2930213 RepID=UPI0022281140|nr:3'-5' exonuclease [Entomomonas sp. E2T0]UYZ83817.1 exonuclease domain-containing protein [Entomomonas sp. E2T0]